MLVELLEERHRQDDRVRGILIDLLHKWLTGDVTGRT